MRARHLKIQKLKIIKSNLPQDDQKPREEIIRIFTGKLLHELKEHFNIEDVDNDGNCFYRAILKALVDDDSEHLSWL